MILSIDLIKQNDEWKKCKTITKKYLSKLTYEILNHFSFFNKIKQLEMSISLCDDDYMQNINKCLRNNDKSTNVISVSYNDDGFFNNINHFIEYLHLGDIAFSYKIIYNESVKQNKKFIDHFTHLLVHGILHLLQYTHQDEQDTLIMQDIEIEILKKFNIKDPYIYQYE